MRPAAAILVLIPMLMLIVGFLMLLGKYAYERKLSEVGLALLFMSAVLGNALHLLQMSVMVEKMDILDHAGIKCVKQCTIDTTNCHSNWYEIVWKDAASKEAAMKSSAIAK